MTIFFLVFQVSGATWGMPFVHKNRVKAFLVINCIAPLKKVSAKVCAYVYR